MSAYNYTLTDRSDGASFAVDRDAAIEWIERDLRRTPADVLAELERQADKHGSAWLRGLLRNLTVTYAGQS